MFRADRLTPEAMRHLRADLETDPVFRGAENLAGEQSEGEVMSSPIYQSERRAPRETKPLVIPDPDGTREEKQLWMREHMARKAYLAGKRPDEHPHHGRRPVVGRKPRIHPRSAIAILAGMVDLNKALANRK